VSVAILLDKFVMASSQARSSSVCSNLKQMEDANQIEHKKEELMNSELVFKLLFKV
jgi:hypothetical protein